MEITPNERKLFSKMGKESWKKREKKFKTKEEKSKFFSELAKKKKICK